MAYDKRKMQDIKFSEKNLLEEYKALYAEGDFDGIDELVQDNPDLKYKIINAYNWNRILNLVHDGTIWDTATHGRFLTDATEDSLAGAWAADYNRLYQTTKDFEYKGEWAIGQTYKKNNLVKVGEYAAYYCLQDHTASALTKPPKNSYWVFAGGVDGVIGIPISTTAPADLVTDDIWFKQLDT